MHAVIKSIPFDTSSNFRVHTYAARQYTHTHIYIISHIYIHIHICIHTYINTKQKYIRKTNLAVIHLCLRLQVSVPCLYDLLHFRLRTKRLHHRPWLRHTRAESRGTSRAKRWHCSRHTEGWFRGSSGCCSEVDAAC